MAKKSQAEQEPVIQRFEEAPTEGIEIDLPEDEVIVETEVSLTPEPEAKEPVADSPLQAALDAQRRAEELQRAAQRERDDALRQARDHERELERERGERQEAEYSSVLTAIAAETAALEKAESDYAAFAAAGDWANAGKAQRVLATAAARLDKLEDGKQAFDSRREADKSETPPKREAAPPKSDFEARIEQLPDTAKTWLRKNPQFINDPALNDKIGAVHNYLVKAEGVEPFSAAYFDALDVRLGLKAAAAEPEPKVQPKRSTIPMTAPVSRDVPTASGTRQNGKMMLTAEERALARVSIVDRPDMPKLSNEEKELLYARNKARLLKMRANGEYRQTTEQTG